MKKNEKKGGGGGGGGVNSTTTTNNKKTHPRVRRHQLQWLNNQTTLDHQNANSIQSILHRSTNLHGVDSGALLMCQMLDLEKYNQAALEQMEVQCSETSSLLFRPQVRWNPYMRPPRFTDIMRYLIRLHQNKNATKKPFAPTQYQHILKKKK